MVTRDKTYESMALVSRLCRRMHVPGAHFRLLQLEQVRIVFNRSTKVVVAKAPKSHKKQDTGKQPTADSEAPKNYSSELRDFAGDAGVDKALDRISGLRFSGL